jgi:hypothetical protein
MTPEGVIPTHICNEECVDVHIYLPTSEVAEIMGITRYCLECNEYEPCRHNKALNV